jgi:uncharacterized protein YecT (DUF1311 family)
MADGAQQPMQRIVYKSILWSLVSAVCAFCASGQQGPCPNLPNASNVEMRECYTTEQARINKEADALAAHIAATFRKDAKKEADGPVVSNALRKAAFEVTNSQATWRMYRDQHCRAVMYSYTTGSGAGRAYEECLFDLGTSRVKDLRRDFAGSE